MASSPPPKFRTTPARLISRLSKCNKIRVLPPSHEYPGKCACFGNNVHLGFLLMDRRSNSTSTAADEEMLLAILPFTSDVRRRGLRSNTTYLQMSTDLPSDKFICGSSLTHIGSRSSNYRSSGNLLCVRGPHRILRISQRGIQIRYGRPTLHGCPVASAESARHAGWLLEGFGIIRTTK